MRRDEPTLGSAPLDGADSDRLDSWKEIAAYLKRDVRTVHRWEAEQELPVRRQLHNKRSTVFAYKSELADWQNARQRIDAEHFRSQRSRTVKMLAAGVVGVLLLTLATFLLIEQVRRSTPIAATQMTLAVLPFDNPTSDADQEYFSDGITGETIATLAKLQPGRLAVIASSSTKQYKRSRKRLDEIARELGADYLLQGSVQRRNGQVFVSAWLIRVRDQEQLWNHEYTRDLRDIFALQNDVARDVSQSVALELSPTQQVRLANFRQADPDAYENYLKGLYFWDKFTEAGMRKSIDHLQTSIDREPTYAMPYARLARAYGILGNFGSLRPDEAYPRQEAVARKALALDDTLDEAHTAVGWSRLFYNRDWQGAQEEFRRAVELNPNSAVAHQGYAAYFLAMGDIDLALAEISRAQKLDPVSLNVKTDIAWILLCARRTDEAIAQLRQVREMDPGFPLAHFYFANAYMQKALFEQAIAEADTAVKLFQADARPRGLLGHAYAVAGRKIEAEQVLAELQKMGRRDYVSPYNIALIYAALGDKDRAFEWLEKAYSDRFWMMSFLKVDPRWDRLRSDARFQDLLRRMAFPS